MASESKRIADDREYVFESYNLAKTKNNRSFNNGDDGATSEYIYPNQIEDANNIVDLFYKNDRRVISVKKKTKVGADGLMIETTKQMATHNDDNFIVKLDNIYFLTGMSNVGWQNELIGKVPECFKDKIFHHRQLGKAELKNMSNSLIIIDEIDCGSKEQQELHKTLKEADLLDVKNMKEHNNRFLLISATMGYELNMLTEWGELHETYKMTIPDSYIGHKDFLEKGIIQEFYNLSIDDNANRWVREDIIENYGTDYRVHIVRTNTDKATKLVKEACIKQNVAYIEHNSCDRIKEKILFNEPLTKHTVLIIKGFYRRATLFPNKWKLRIGATHELYTEKPDSNVQTQGLPGRMSGYWREHIENGHKTGPHRCSVSAIIENEKIYDDPSQCLNKNSKTNKTSFLAPKNIKNLVVADRSDINENVIDIRLYRIYSDETIVKSVCKLLGYKYISTKDNEEGFKETSLNKKKGIVSLRDAINKVPQAYGTYKGIITYRTYYPCYIDPSDKNSLRYVVIIRPETDVAKITQCDLEFTQA